MNIPRTYRKRPVEIEAMHFAGSNADMHAVYKWVEAGTEGSFDPAALTDPDLPIPTSGVSIDPATGRMMIATLEGIMYTELGDWVVRGVEGEFYPVKPSIFTATYESPTEVGTRGQA